MAGQGIERREVIRMLGMASVASAFPGFQRWAFACAQVKAATTGPNKAFQPQFFTPGEFKLVDRLADMIIPTDEHPGAHEAGVAEFIDFMVFNGVNLSSGASPGAPRTSRGPEYDAIQDQFRSGLHGMNARMQSLHGHPFLECTESQQTELLQHLAYKTHFRGGEEPGRRFFHLIRDYTVKGYYSSHIGLEALGFPGLQTMWTALPGCPHKGDPEHLHLQPAV